MRSPIWIRSRTRRRNRPWTEVFAQRLDPEFAEKGRDPTRLLDYVGECVNRPGFATTSPRFMAYIPGGGLFHSALGDLLAAMSNKYSGFRLGQSRRGAARERLHSVAGERHRLSGDCGGHADPPAEASPIPDRDRRRPRGSRPDGGGAVYMTRFAHYCIDKALHIAGRGRSPRRQIETDDQHRMSVGARRGRWSATAATAFGRGWSSPRPGPSTRVRSTRCRRSPSSAGDMAPGFMSTAPMAGLFALVRRGQGAAAGHRAGGQRRVDPHKTLFLPYGTGAALVREGRHLLQAFSATADYPNPLGEIRGRAIARRPVARAHPSLPRNASVASAADRRHLRFSRRPDGEARARPLLPRAPVGDRRVRPGPPPTCRSLPSATCRRGDADDFTERLLKHLQQEGRVMSGTRIDGTYYIRCAILCFRPTSSISTTRSTRSAWRGA